jgi:hypothetical protein
MRFTTGLRALTMASGISLLVGCATSPIGSGEASMGHAIPNEWQLPAPNTGKFVVTRDSGLMGAACSQRIYVDGTPIGDLRTGQKVTVYLPAGEHVAGVKPAGICGGGSASAQVVMAAGATKLYRVASGQSGDVKIEPSAF